LGGEERIDDKSSSWGDSFIVNLGTKELESAADTIHPRDLGNWHVDGDFFVSELSVRLSFSKVGAGSFPRLAGTSSTRNSHIFRD
jgi:hypothetical protein